ncbi:MAG: DUF559 domain-containing protein [Candidatus Moranbacteria bacterium]|nr:DUF559 domain-containing protein [Candidatus Moranbacteria bacterium]
MKIKFIPKYNSNLVRESRLMRKNQTKAEKEIWGKVLSRKQTGYKFRRQKPINRFIVDFYCKQLLLIIEIDGKDHEYKKDYDKEREAYLKKMGFEIIRYTNEEIIDNLKEIKENLYDKLKLREKELLKKFKN